MRDKFKLQSAQYEFPYHYLVDLSERSFGRNLDWGLDYLSYVETVISLVKRYAGRDLLDVGCGDGFLLYNLARERALHPDVRLVGIDLDEKAIKFAQAFCHGLATEFMVKDIAQYEDQFDVITAVETFEHIPDDEIVSFTGHVDRLLRPRGCLVVSVPSAVRPVIEKHYRHYTLEMLQQYFPTFQAMEVRYVTARRNLLYQIVSRLLSNRHLNLNIGWLGDALFSLHSRFTRDVSEARGAHIVAAFRKSDSGIG